MAPLNILIVGPTRYNSLALSLKECLSSKLKAIPSNSTALSLSIDMLSNELTSENGAEIAKELCSKSYLFAVFYNFVNNPAILRMCNDFSELHSETIVFYNDNNENMVKEIENRIAKTRSTKPDFKGPLILLERDPAKLANKVIEKVFPEDYEALKTASAIVQEEFDLTCNTATVWS